MTEPAWMNGDAIVACADLVERCGATGFEIGHIRDDVPAEEAGWYAHATFRGARLTAEEHRSPSAAALGLAERILKGGACRCGRNVTLDDTRPGCRWQLMGKRWEPGCNAPPVHVQGPRGDVPAMHAAMNRRQRRAHKKRSG